MTLNQTFSTLKSQHTHQVFLHISISTTPKPNSPSFLLLRKWISKFSSTQSTKRSFLSCPYNRMIMSSSSGHEGGISIQSCFPPIQSVAGSSCKSDASISINCSDDDISLKDVICPSIAYHNNNASFFSVNGTTSLTLRRQLSSPCLTFSDTQSSYLRPDQAIPSSIGFPKVEGSDADIILDPSIWPHSLTRDRIPYTALEFPTEVAVSRIGKIGRNSITPYVPLHLAALKGDWDSAKEFLTLYPEAVGARMTRNLETALHIAAGARHTTFVRELVKLMAPEDLELQNKSGNTALCFAAASGITKNAEEMVNKNRKLPSIRGSKGAKPLLMAALLGHRDMVWYLYSLTEGEVLTEKDHTELLVAVITADLYDVALDIIQNYPELAIATDGNGETALHVLARKPMAFPSRLGALQRCIYTCLPMEGMINASFASTSHRNQSCSGFRKLAVLLLSVFKYLGTKAIFDAKLMHIQAIELVKKLWEQILLLDDLEIGELLRKPSRLLFVAAEIGNVEFLTVLIRMYPDLIWKVDSQSRSIFHVAVAHRQRNVFNLIYEIGAHKDLIAAYKDRDNNNMLHLAAKLAPPNRLKTDSGAALQLRRELHWFKEVEKIVQPSFREMMNSEGKTPYILFTEEHRMLVREGEKWMKDTASSCMVVATLIATVMFAAIFTVPGGNNNETGRPIFLRDTSFMVFSISNALALFSSATSILMFLSIITSRYAEEDFLHSLPQKLIIGLASLFISIASMMVAFAATHFIVLGHDFAWIAIPIASVACVPVSLFAMLQFPLFADMMSHVYSFSSLFCAKNHLLY